MNKSRLLALVIALMGWSHFATAFTVACPDNIVGNVTGTGACEYSSSATQDFQNVDPLTVNAEAFFTFTDWSFLAKDEADGGLGQSGSWALDSSYWSLYSDIMLVFKSGSDTTLVGYEVLDGTISGTWTSPFENPPFDVKNTKDVSHISYYGRGGASVPEPSSLGLLAAGFLGLAATRRLTRRA